MNHPTTSRTRFPGASPENARRNEAHQIALAKHVDGAILGALLGALSGALLGAFFGWLAGGMGWKIGEKWLGGDEATMAGEVGAVLGGVIAVFMSQQLSVRPVLDTLLWVLIGIEVWLVARLVGQFALGWDIAGTGFSWATGGFTIGVLGGSRGLAAHYASGGPLNPNLDSDRPNEGIAINQDIPSLNFLDWGLGIIKVFPGAKGAAVGSALFGAIGGGAGGWVYGVFTGDLGRSLVAAPLGTLLAGAVLGAVGAGAGAYLAVRRYDRPVSAKAHADALPLVETVD